jgi:hypothetical protein
MIDTLRLMQLVDRVGSSTSLDEACRAIVQSSALGHPFDAASLLVRDHSGLLYERGRHQLPGSPEDFAALSLTFPTPLALALARPRSSIISLESAQALHPEISYPLESSPFASVWLLPLVTMSEPFAVLMAFSAQADKPTLEVSHERLLASGVKLAVRQNSWRFSNQPSPSVLAG